MRALRALRRLSLDVRMGHCSGFRPCCIAFFTLVWSPVARGSVDEHCVIHRGRLHQWYWDLLLSTHVQYVPCPLCLLRRDYVDLRQCDVACGHHAEAMAFYGK